GDAAVGPTLVNLTHGLGNVLGWPRQGFRGPWAPQPGGPRAGGGPLDQQLPPRGRSPTAQGSFFVQAGSREAQCLHNGRPLQQQPRRLRDGDHLLIPTRPPQREGPSPDDAKPCVALAFRASAGAEAEHGALAAPAVVCLTRKGAPRQLLGVDGGGSIDLAGHCGSEAPAARLVGLPGRRPVFQQLSPQGSFVNGTLMKEDPGAECTIYDRDVIFPCKSAHKFRGSLAYIFLGGSGRMPATPLGGWSSWARAALRAGAVRLREHREAIQWRGATAPSPEQGKLGHLGVTCARFALSVHSSSRPSPPLSLPANSLVT
ncbi:unnamed protein product, partial [Prorocentrum cordatum]